jgi:hypothetical protein
MSQSLMSLIDQSARIEKMLVESDGEIGPELEAMLAQIDISLPEKIDDYDFRIERMEIISEFYKRKASFYIKLADSAAAAAKRCKDNLKAAMITLGTDEIEGNDVRFKLSASNPSCVIENESKIDDCYKIIETSVKIDKKRIIEELKLNLPVFGARLEYGKSLRRYPKSPSKGKIK